MKVAVVYGGFSSEIEISKKSGKSVAGWLRNAGYEVYEVLLTKEQWAVVVLKGNEEVLYPIDRNDFSSVIDGVKVNFDNVFIIIHGDPGENGKLQAYFELIGQKFIGCDSFSMTVSFDKYSCKRYLQDAGVHLSEDILVRKGDSYCVSDIVSRLGLPVFVKATNGGSSFGVTKVKKAEDMEAALNTAFGEGNTAIIERAITGREIDCGVYQDREGIHALPPIEIVPENEYFDYEAKYLGASQEICPARISDAETKAIQDEAVKIFRHLGCKDLVRMDFILTEDGKPYFLELNPNPGMTAQSLVPQEVREAGMTMEEFFRKIIG